MDAGPEDSLEREVAGLRTHCHLIGVYLDLRGKAPYEDFIGLLRRIGFWDPTGIVHTD